MEAIPSMRVSAILESANHLHPKMPFEIPSKGDHIPLGRIDQTYEKMICTQAPLALKTDPTKEGYAMTKHLPHSHKCFAAFLCLLFFVVCLLMLPIQTIACTDSGRVIRTINVVASDSVNFTYTPASPVKGQPVQFTDTSTGSPILWRWDFGDGTGTTSTSKNPSYTYTTGGTYMVTLTVLYSSGPERAGQMVTVVSELTASFTYSPSSPAEGQAVQFTDTSSGSPTSWQWSFGDGAYSTSQNPSHTYTAAVTYTITLTVTNSSGSKSMSQTITVVPVFAASFTYSPSSPVEGQAVQFTDTSIGSPTSWQWNFGDGATNTSQNPSHPYAVAGCYDMYLTIMKGTNSDTTRQAITVRHVITAASPSYADVSAAVNSAVPGDTVLVPAGSATWASTLVVTKGISIIGAGIGNTIISSSQKYLFQFHPDSTTRSNQDRFRLSGFTWAGSPSYAVIALEESNSETVPIRNVRIDHCRWETSTGYPIYIDGNFWGVVDSNQFAGYNFFMLCGNEDTDWKEFYPVSCGSADNIYFEDNVFSGSYFFAIQSGQGGRWAFRYNTINSTEMGNAMFDQHGSQDFLGGDSYNVYALMLCEIYENTFTWMTTDVNRWEGARGGKLLMYNNTGASPSGTPEIKVNDQTRGGANVPPPIYTPYDCYFWNNIWNGSRINCQEGNDDYGTIAENVTFWNQNDSFNGSAGIGVGLLSARPTTCTTGVAYWATDTRTLYKATAPNTWAIYYTPYTYPHPLRK
jgi:PKD repeat protein